MCLQLTNLSPQTFPPALTPGVRIGGVLVKQSGQLHIIFILLGSSIGCQ